MLLTHQRGAIFWAQVSKNVQGSVQDGVRPVLVVSNDINNLHSTVVTVVAITSQKKPNLPTHVQIPAINGDGLNTILCEQITTLPKDVLKRYQGCLTEDTMKHVETALLIQLGLKKQPVETKTVQTKTDTDTETDTEIETKPETETIEKPATDPRQIRYSTEFKKAYVKNSKRMTNAELAEKYGIDPKTAWARTKAWTKQFK